MSLIVGAVLELQAKQPYQSNQFTVKMRQMGCIDYALTFSPKTAPRILIFFNCHGCHIRSHKSLFYCHLSPQIFADDK